MHERKIQYKDRENITTKLLKYAKKKYAILNFIFRSFDSVVAIIIESESFSLLPL